MTRWMELAPRGAQPAGHIGGDIQVTEAWSRRWAKRHPKRRDHVLVIDEAVYGCEARDRRWIQTQVNYYIALLPAEEGLREAEIDLSTAEHSHTTYDDSLEDREAADGWPTDKDLQADVNRWKQPMGFSWDGES